MLKDRVQKLLDEVVDPFHPEDDGKTALHYVAEGVAEKNTERIAFHDEKQGDTKDRDGQSAIYYAVTGSNDKPFVLQRILEAAATDPVFVKVFSQTTPLHMAAGRGNLKMVEELLSVISAEERKKNYVESPDVMGQTALHKAASGGHWKVVDKAS
ncbi:hypothetical protein SUGI_0440800 [Cryptomeria japonica]|nr:hypothetical protein SUGI_0440800 [Cryptomeria japonica]